MRKNNLILLNETAKFVVIMVALFGFVAYLYK